MPSLHVVPAWRVAVRDAATLRASDRLVALTLSTFMDGAGRARVARTTIAAAAGVSLRTVVTAVARLEAACLLDVERGRGGRAITNAYTAKRCNTCTVTDDETVQHVHRLESETVQDLHINGATGAPVVRRSEDQNARARARARTAPEPDAGGVPFGAGELADAARAARRRLQTKEDA